MRLSIFSSAMVLGGMTLTAIAWEAPLHAQLPGIDLDLPAVPRVAPDVVPRVTQPLNVPRATRDLAPGVQPLIEGEGLAAFSHQAAAGWQVDAATDGVRIGQIETGGLAAQSGFQVGDTIRAVNRTWVRSPQDLASHLSAAARGQGAAWVYIARNGQPQWIRVDFAAHVMNAGQVGLGVVDRNGLVEIQEVRAGSLASKLRLRTGDQIVSVNGRQVVSAEDFSAQFNAAARTSPQVFVRIRRDGNLYQVQATAAQLRVRADGVVDAAVAAAVDAGAKVGAQLSVDAVQAAVNGPIDGLHKMAGDLTGHIDRLGDQATAEVRQQVVQLGKTVNGVRADVQALASAKAEAVHDRVAGLHRNVAALHRDLLALAPRVEGDARVQVDGMARLAAELEIALAAMLKK